MNSASNPLVSVVIPTYNREDVIKRCIKSVLNQTYDNIEIIVVDDGSTDSTQEIVQNIESEDINYHYFNNNLGANVARNKGIELASGDLIGFLDSDDIWLPDKTAKQVSVFNNSNDRLGVVYSGYYVSDQYGKRIGELPQISGDIFEEELSGDKISPTSTVMVRQECFEKVGGFNEELPARQDYNMWFRISKKYKFDYVNEPLAKINLSRDDRISEDFDQRMKANRYMLEKVKQEVSDYNKLKKMKILSGQYRSISRYCFIHHYPSNAQKYSLQAIKYYPFSLEQWAILILSTLRISPHNPVLLYMKDKYLQYQY